MTYFTRLAAGAPRFLFMAGTLALFFIVQVSSRDSLSAPYTQSLSGPEWSVINDRGNITANANVPGSIYLDLLDNKILIEDPLYRDNYQKYLWVANENWNYIRKFTLDEELLQSKEINLVCEGLDTIAEVLINGKSVLNTNNMHVKYTVNIKPFLQLSAEATQLLIIQFESPVAYAKAYAAAYPYPLPAADPPTNVPNRQFMRKAQNDFGWGE
jgi:beta-mannosidase